MATAEPTPCPVELCEETVDYIDLIPHLYSDHDGQELCEAIANLVADLAQEERACAERGKYLAEVDAALTAAGQDEAGGYIAYPRRVQQLAAESLFWHFEYREAMDNYKGEAAALRDARAELATARAELADWQAAHAQRLTEAATAIRFLDRNDAPSARAVLLTQSVGGDTRLDRILPAACTCGAEAAHQHGCPAAN